MVALVLLTQQEMAASAAAAAEAAAAAAVGNMPSAAVGNATSASPAFVPVPGSADPADTVDGPGDNGAGSGGSGGAALLPGPRPFSVAGDVAATLAAVCMAVNLLIGGRLRAWMPLWLYSLPTFAAAAAAAAALSLAVERDAALWGFGHTALLGWLGDGRRLGLAFAMAFVPTLLGHTVSNFALSHIQPLVLSVLLLAAPPLSALYGYALGLQGPPGRGLLLGGPVILLGIGVAVLGGHKSPLWGLLAKARERWQRGRAQEQPQQLR